MGNDKKTMKNDESDEKRRRKNGWTNAKAKKAF
jgi:hypothetical protein